MHVDHFRMKFVHGFHHLAAREEEETLTDAHGIMDRLQPSDSKIVIFHEIWMVFIACGNDKNLMSALSHGFCNLLSEEGSATNHRGIGLSKVYDAHNNSLSVFQTNE